MGIETKVEDVKAQLENYRQFYQIKTALDSSSSQRYSIKQVEKQTTQYRNTRIF
jgi:hypothetical protein